MAGDKIDIRKDGYIYLNGEKLTENYLKDLGSTYQNNLEMPLIVPEGKVFVMGDNRMNSRDSREIGFVDINDIRGKVALIYSFDPGALSYKAISVTSMMTGPLSIAVLIITTAAFFEIIKKESIYLV